MPTQSHEIVTGLIIVMIVLLIAVSFIFLLVNHGNKRKHSFLQEKQALELRFREQLLQAQQEMQEQTFNNISQEIHDNVGQVLSLAKVQLNTIEQKKTLDMSLLHDAKDSISKAMIDLRDIARRLSADRVKVGNLIDLTEHELQRIRRLGMIETILHTEGNEIAIDDSKKIIIWRIMQESLQNILKHAAASKIEVAYRYEREHLQLEIRDDGIGFDMSKLKTDGLGLQNLTGRAALIGGSCSVKSALQQGTLITIIIPYA